eukprot:a680215_59.p1 GENE.a680215_59~~a680215_59.p1  ORF type:complete len:225 (+),score=34.55 a680215_59:40-675(+)
MGRRRRAPVPPPKGARAGVIVVRASHPISGLLGWGGDLRRACERGDFDAATAILSARCEPSSPDYVCLAAEVCEMGTGRNPLHAAALHGHEKIVEALVEKWGVPVNAKATLGNTALHEAAFNSHAATISLLLSLGADPLEENVYGRPAIDCCGRGDRAFKRPDDTVLSRDFLSCAMSRNGRGTPSSPRASEADDSVDSNARVDSTAAASQS